MRTVMLRGGPPPSGVNVVVNSNMAHFFGGNFFSQSFRHSTHLSFALA